MASVQAQLKQIIENTFGQSRSRDISYNQTQTQTQNQSIEFLDSKMKLSKHHRYNSLNTECNSPKKNVIELIIPSKQARLSTIGQIRIKRDLISLKNSINPAKISHSGFRNRPKPNLNRRIYEFNKREFLSQSPTYKTVVYPRDYRNKSHYFRELTVNSGDRKFKNKKSDQNELNLFMKDLSRGKTLKF